jgi:hypothetical protein
VDILLAVIKLKSLSSGAERLKRDRIEQSFYTKIKFSRCLLIEGFRVNATFLSAANMELNLEIGTIGESSAELVRIYHD